MKAIVILALVLPLNLLAAKDGLLNIEPIVGYERTQKLLPTPRTVSRFFYGARATYGIPLISAEAEVTQSKENESFPELNQSIDETANTGKLGLRSRLYSGSIMSFYLRAGGHARQRKITTTTNGVSVVEEPAVKVRPYAGAGFRFRLMSNFNFSITSTVVFDEPVAGEQEVQTSAGFGIRF